MPTQNQIKVEVVKSAPDRFTNMLSGIRTKQEAEHWAQKNGFTVVYFLPTRERVYAQQMNKTAVKAKELETKSVRLLAHAEAAMDRAERSGA